MAIRAFILVTTKPGTSHDIVRSRLIRGVKLAASVYGRFDAVVVVEAKTLEELSKIVYEVIGQHKNVEHTETLISLYEPEKEEA